MGRKQGGDGWGIIIRNTVVPDTPYIYPEEIATEVVPVIDPCVAYVVPRDEVDVS
jgi:hypothetical protein